jgi:hypothetical protein
MSTKAIPGTASLFVAPRQTATWQKNNPTNANQKSNNTGSKGTPSEVPMGWWKKKWEFIIEPKHSNAVVAIFSALLFFATLAYIVFAALQWCANKKAADAAKDSVDLARRNAHFDQRAWLGISYGPQNYTVNKPFAPTLEIVNTGRTPARKVNGVAVTCFLKNGEQIPPFTYDHATHINLGMMLPGIKQGGISYLIPIGVPKDEAVEPLIISNAMFRSLKGGTGYILIYGRFEYDSVFGAHHWMTFCASNVEFTQPKECVNYNDVDNNEEP